MECLVVCHSLGLTIVLAGYALLHSADQVFVHCSLCRRHVERFARTEAHSLGVICRIERERKTSQLLDSL